MIDQTHYIIKGLKVWRQKRLEEIETEMRDLWETISMDEAVLDVAYKNPGQVPHDIIEGAASRRDRDAAEYALLEKKHDWLVSQDTRTSDGVAKLLTAFERELTKKSEGEITGREKQNMTGCKPRSSDLSN